MVTALGVWGQRWSRRQLAEGEVDVNLLAWSLERGVDATAFGNASTVIQIRFTDQTEAKSRWWFINRNSLCELCLEDPGHEVDLYLSTTVRDMIYIVRGDLALTHALEEGKLDVIGPRSLRSRLRKWLNLSPLAKVRSRRADGVISKRAA